jgi:hypothetical protein
MVTNDKTNPFFLFWTEPHSLELKLFILSTYSAWIISLLCDKYWLLKTDSLHRGGVGDSKMIIRNNINGTVCATVRLTRTTETDSGGAKEV